MIRVTIICDHAEGARAKEGKPSNYCVSLVPDNNPQAEHRSADVATSTVREAARNDGWKQTKVDNRGKHGWLCPPCYGRAYEGK
jgi:hypothetical protein